MQQNRKFVTAFLALVIAFTQSGCLIGFLVPPLILPLAVSGTLIGVTGGTLTGVGFYKQSSPLLAAGAGFIIIGSILGKDNPDFTGSLSEALNPIPRDQTLAQKLGVTLDDITDYNDNLNPISHVAQNLARDLSSQFKRPEFRKILNVSQLAQDSQIDLLARKYGFNGSREFIEALNADKLSQQALERFSQATQLSTTQAKILLHYGFAIRSS